MWAYLPIILIVLPTFTSTSLNKVDGIPGFIFSMPKVLLTGKNETVCLSTHHTPTNNASTPIKIVIDLKLKEKHFFTIRTIESEHTCFELNVPDVDLKESKFINVRIQVQLNGVIYASRNQDPVVIYPNKKVTFIETDKGTYKSGDKIRIRVLVLAQNLLPPRDYKIREIKIRNPLGIVVTLWENVTTEVGLAQVEHQIGTDPVEGNWKIEAENEVKTFEVRKYVLPKFKVDLHHPKTIHHEAAVMTIKICARYSYGAKVEGSAFVKITDSQQSIAPLQNMRVMTNGCAEFLFHSHDLGLSKIKERYSSMLDPKVNLHVTATVTEYGTDRIEVANAKISITLKPYNLHLNCDKTFLPGLAYQGKLQVTNINKDLNGEVIQICYTLAIKKSWNYVNEEQCRNFTLIGETLLKFHILPLRSSVIHLHVQARSLNHSNVGDSLTAVRLFSPGLNYIQLEFSNNVEKSKCKSIQQFVVSYNTDNLTGGENITFYYMIRTRGSIHKMRKIVQTVRKGHPNYLSEYRDIIGGSHKYQQLGSSVHKFVLKFKLDEKIISNYEFLVYYVTKDGETVVATKHIEIEPCLITNKVTSKWLQTQLNPGATASLQIETKSDSLCAISAVDKSTKFLEDATDHFTPKIILEPFLIERDVPPSDRKICIRPPKKTQDMILAAPLVDVQSENENMYDLRKRKKRHVYSFSEDIDAHDVFNAFGTNIITNFNTVSKLCYTGPILVETTSPVQSLTDQYNPHNEDKIVPIRSFFPETWLWELVPVSRTAVIHRDLPHTITDWQTNVLCVSDGDGVGISETTKISAFQPFFVDVLTPYSVKRGEILYLHVMIFNYLNYSLPIRVTLGESDGLNLVNTKGMSQSYCLDKLKSRSHVFELHAVEIGDKNLTVLAEIDSNFPGYCGPEVMVNKRDVVFKTLRIEPEGYPKKETRSSLLCAEDGTTPISTRWEVNVPNGVVPGTLKSSVTINGDLLGQSIENLGNLISMPTGCGEQIMSTLAPNLYVLDYLRSTKSLTNSIRTKAVRNLKIGYHRILNFVHPDGSFSAFGNQDSDGSMFLTAMVVKTLQEAKSYIYVDQKVIERAVNWILEHQLENGCFSPMLHVFQDMGGTSAENSTASLTSYVMITLLESNKTEISENVKNNAKYCIRGHYQLDKYTLAVSSYALCKINWYEEAHRMLDKLQQMAERKDDMMWWSNSDGESTKATDIEITSYALLTLLHHKSEENLAKAHSVVRWLSSQINSKGGFSSTQDTNVALEALAKYSTIIARQDTNLDILIETSDQFQRLKINTEDRLKAKTISLSELDNDFVKISVQGRGCVLAQETTSFYLRRVPSNQAFKLETEIAPVSNVDQCSVASLTACFAGSSSKTHTNMAILEVGLPSGYQADRASLYELIQENTTNLKKFEEIDDKVMFYFTDLNEEQICINFKINENAVVKTRAESAIRLYDYYKPEYGVLQFYKMNDNCGLENLTMPEIPISVADNELKDFEKRSVDNLNPDFVDMSIELATPKGEEGNQPVYVNVSRVSNQNSIENDFITTKDANETNATEINPSLNPNFVDLDLDMATPGGIEGVEPIYVKYNQSRPFSNFQFTINNREISFNTSAGRKNANRLEENVPAITEPSSNTIRKRRQTKKSKLNPDFVDMDVEMATPAGIEGNVPMYTPKKSPKTN